MAEQEEKKIRISRPVIVEGRYDQNKLQSLLDAPIVTTEGFGIFHNTEKAAFIRRLAEKSGVIVLTDSDGAGLVIRNWFNSVLPPDRVTHVYIPPIPGREKRKSAPSREGLLGVEGMEADCLRRLFAPLADDAPTRAASRPITRADLMADGLSGGPGSAGKRAALLAAAALPSQLSCKAMLTALNLLYTYDEYRALLQRAAI